MPQIVINQARCKGCGYCVDVCPKHLISVNDRMNERGVYPVFCAASDQCSGCRLCVTVCPDVAITLYNDR
ncbi:MAG: ferredoxin family protein [PVC group bacterium]